MGEGGLAVGKVVIPCADEPCVEAEGADLVEASIEAFAPDAEGAGVVGSEVAEVVEVHVAGASDGLVDAVEGEEEGAWEYVLLDPVHAAAHLVVAGVGAGDELGSEDAAGAEDAMDDGEVGLQECVADGLEHLDAGDAVEGFAEGWDVAVVEEEDVGAVGDPLALEESEGMVPLLGAEGDGGDPAAVVLDGVAGKAAPARADFEHVEAGLESELAAEAVVLGDLGGLEGMVWRLEEGRRVGERGVEPKTVEGVPDVVVGVDVASGSDAGIAVEEMAETVGGGEEPEGKRAVAGAGEGGGVVGVGAEPCDDGREVVGVPFAGLEGFAEADVAGRNAAPEEAGVMDGEEGLGTGEGSAEGHARAIGEEDVEATALHRMQEGCEGGLAPCVDPSRSDGLGVGGTGSPGDGWQQG